MLKMESINQTICYVVSMVFNINFYSFFGFVFITIKHETY